MQHHFPTGSVNGTDRRAISHLLSHRNSLWLADKMLIPDPLTFLPLHQKQIFPLQEYPFEWLCIVAWPVFGKKLKRTIINTAAAARTKHHRNFWVFSPQ